MGPGRVSEPIMGASTHACQCRRGLALIRLIISLGCMRTPAPSVFATCIPCPCPCPCPCPTTGQRTRANDQRPRPPPLVSHRPRHRLRHDLVDAVSFMGVPSIPGTVGLLRTQRSALTYPLTHSTHRTHDGDANLAWRHAPDHTGAAITARYYTQPSRTFLSFPAPGAVAESQSQLAGERICILLRVHSLARCKVENDA